MRSIFRFFGQKFALKLSQLFGEGIVQVGWCCEEVVDDELVRAVALERRMPCQHLVQHDAKRVDVTGRRQGKLSSALFRRHVQRRANELAISCDGACALGQASDSKVEDLGALGAVFSSLQEDVFGFQVTVNDPMVMSHRESVADLQGDRKDMVERGEPFFFQHFLEGLPLQVFHHHVGTEGWVDGEVVDADDVFVLKLGSGAGFAEEAVAHTGLRCNHGVQDLERKDAVQLDVAGAVHNGCGAFTNALEEFVVSNDLVDPWIFGSRIG